MKNLFDIKKIIFVISLVFTAVCFSIPQADAGFATREFKEVKKNEKGEYITVEEKSWFRRAMQSNPVTGSVIGAWDGAAEGWEKGNGFWDTAGNVLVGSAVGSFKGKYESTQVQGIIGGAKGAWQGLADGYKQGDGFWDTAYQMGKNAITGAYGGAKDAVNKNKTVEAPYCEASTTKCMPYCKYEARDICLLCPMFAVVFNAVNQVAVNAINAFSGSVAKVVVIGFGIWLAIQILGFVSSIETRDLKDLMSAIMTQAFVVMLVFMILSNGVSSFFNTFISPIYMTGQTMAQAMFSSCVSGSEASSGEASQTKCEPQDKDVQKKIVDSGYIETKKGGISPEMGHSIIQTMTMMENRVRKVQSLGSGLMCQSFAEGAVWGIFPRMSYLITGFGIWVFATMIIVAVPFLMVDAVFQLAVAMALLPAAVGGFAFKVTRQYTKKVWETLLNSMFAFLFISVVVLILLGVLWAAVTGNTEIMAKEGLDFEQLFTPHAAETKMVFEKLMGSIQWISPHFLRLIFVFILAWSVMEMAKELAQTFADSISSTSIGSSIGTMAASTAKGMATKLSSPYTHAAKKSFESRMDRLALNLRRKASGKLFKWKSNRVAKKQSTGNREYKVENGVITKIKRDGNSTVETIETKDAVIVKKTVMKKIKGKDVAVTKQEIRSKNSKLEEMMDKDGKIDKEALNKYFEGKSAKEKEVALKLLEKNATEKRFGAASKKYRDDQRKVTESEVVQMDTENGKMLIREVTVSGEVIFKETEILDDGQLKTSLTIISEDGDVTVMSSDGVHNKLEKFKLQEGTPKAKVKDINDVYAYRNNSRPTHVNYGYTAAARADIAQGIDPDTFNLGMLSAEERGDRNHRTAFQDIINNKGNEKYHVEMAYYFK